MEEYPKDDDKTVELPAKASCPNDTDGDGNCGRPACPHCGQYQMRPHIEETPAAQRRVDTY